MKPTLKKAIELRANGIATIPVDKDKRPLVSSWRNYMNELPSESDQREWFKNGAGIALVAGQVQCIDVDEKYESGLMEKFKARAIEAGLGSIWESCLIQRTPSGGYHLVFMTVCEPIRNMKLAQKSADEGHETLIETRGMGGYFLIDPSEGYEVIQGDFNFLPCLAEDDREMLLDVARSLNRKVKDEDRFDSDQGNSHSVTPSEGVSPGDDFDQRGDVEGLLQSHGWKKVGKEHWRRPGKDKGISASLGHVPDRFYVFSTSTQFEPEKPYKPYAVYAMLEHGGDFKQAMSELARQGYGTPAKKKDKKSSKDDVGSADHLDPRASLKQAIELKNEEKVEELSEEDKAVLDALNSKFHYDENPECGRTLLMLGETTVATAGNLVAISAQAKAGKTALYSGAMAAALRKGQFLHCSSPDQTGAVIHIDTEQSHYDAHRLGRTVLHRAGIKENDPRYLSFRWRDYSVNVRRRALFKACADAVLEHGWIHSIWLDGVADFVNSVNDEQECNELITDLMWLSTQCDCIVCCVIHLNPGSDAKSRGHLGSALERKAEANIRLNKDNEMVTNVWGERMRGAPILEKDALCFAWDEQAGRHEVVTKQAKAPKGAMRMSQPDAQAHARKLAEREAWKYDDWWQAVMRETGYTGKDYKSDFCKYAVASDNVLLVKYSKGTAGPKPQIIGPENEALKLKVKLEKQYQEAKQKELTVK